MRRVAYNRQERDPDTDAFVGIFPDAFALRSVDKGSLSVTWLEYFGGNYSSNVSASIAVIGRCMKGSQKNAVFAIGNIGEIRKAGRARGYSVRVIYDPSACNFAHSAIRQIAPEDLEMLDELASDIFRDIRSVAGKKL
jgi:hypothetical protein